MKHLTLPLRLVMLVATLSLPFCLVTARASIAASAGTTQSAPEGYSAPALFNQANAFARKGQTGPAILNYERALLLTPADPDIAANLHFVRVKVGLPDTPNNELARCLNEVRPNTLAWLGCVGLVLAGLSLLFVRKFPRRRMVFRLVAFAGALLVAASLGSAVLIWPRTHEAVVLTGDAPARTSPAGFAEPVFKLKAGETVTVQSAHEGFLLVRTPAGRSGWVARSELARVVPLTGFSVPDVNRS